MSDAVQIAWGVVWVLGGLAVGSVGRIGVARRWWLLSGIAGLGIVAMVAMSLRTSLSALSVFHFAIGALAVAVGSIVTGWILDRRAGSSRQS